MKKFLAVLISALTMITMSITVFATQINQDSNLQTGDTTITYTVAPSYTVTIPATVSLGETATISAEGVILNKGEQVIVRLTGTSDESNEFKITTAQGAELTYTVKNGENAVAVGDTVLVVNADAATDSSTTLSFSTPENVQFAGTYSGTVTFEVSVEAAN